MTAHHTSSDYRFAPIPEALLYDADVDHLAVRVYGVLLRHGMTPESCYPSHQRIADCIGAAKRSIQRPLRALEEAGWVERVPRFDDRGDRTSDGFHVLSVKATSAHVDAPPAQDSADPPAQLSADPPRGSARTGEREQVERKPFEREGASTSSTPAPRTAVQALDHLPKDVDPDAVRDLCRLLRERCQAHHPQGRAPTVSVQWVKDMGTLLNTGPCDADGFRPTGAQVHAMIDAVFTRLATPTGSRGFFWANQVNSPGALRRHWVKMELELAPTGARSADDVADAVAKLRGMLDG